MKRIITIAFILIIVGAIGGYIYFKISLKNQKEKIVQLEKNITHLKATVSPIKFKILESDSDNISVAIKFYDLDGNVIKKIEPKISGKDLCFDFVVLKVKDKYIAFPNKIYSNKIAPKDGISIVSEYDKNGFPEIFRSQDINQESIDILNQIYHAVKEGKSDTIQSQFGSMVHDFKEFKSYVQKQIYKIVAHTKGGIEVVEDN